MSASIIKSFLVRIWGPRNNPVGAGWLVAGGHILTCAHLIPDKGQAISLDFPLLGRQRYSAAVVKLFEVKEDAAVDDIEDIAILKPMPDGALPDGAEPAPVWDRHVELYDRAVLACGFPEGMDHGDWVDGALKGFTAKGWVQLDHAMTSRCVSKGFSGTVVWDKQSASVIGMIVGIHTRGQQTSAYMIPITTLAKAWPSLRSPKQKTDDEKPLLGSLVPKLCNRINQDYHFKTFCRTQYERCPRQPQTYVVHGKEGECHASLVARLRDTRVRKLINSNLKATVAPFQIDLPLPFEGDFESRRDILTDRLAEAFGGFSSGPGFMVSDLVNLPGVRRYPLIMFTHDIDAAKWDRHYEHLIQWYVNDFWAMPECREDIPQFLVFLKIIYPSYETIGLLGKMLRAAFPSGKKIAQSLETSLSSAKDARRCLMIPELLEVERTHVNQWFIEYNIPMNEQDRIRCLNDLFAGKQTLPMAKVEAALEAIVQKNARL